MHLTLGELISSYDGKDLPKLSRVEEVALSIRVRDGDLQARNRLVMEARESIPKAVWGYQNKKLGMEPEDLAQESFLEVLENANQYRGEANFSTYGYSIAQRKSIDIYRRRKSRTSRIVEVENIDNIPEDTYRSETLDLTEFERLISKLKKERDREIFRLHFVDEKECDEIATDINGRGYKPLNPQGVRSAIKRGINKLKQIFY